MGTGIKNFISVVVATAIGAFLGLMAFMATMVLIELLF